MRCSNGSTPRPLYDRPPAYQLLLTFGYILVIEEFIRLVWGVNFKAMNAPPALAGTVELFGSTVTHYRLFIIAFGILVSAALFIIERTRIGVVVRAASVNSAMVSCLGIDVGRVRTAVFGAGTMLAGTERRHRGPAAAAQARHELQHHHRLLHRRRDRRTRQHPGC